MPRSPSVTASTPVSPLGCVTRAASTRLLERQRWYPGPGGASGCGHGGLWQWEVRLGTRALREEEQAEARWTTPHVRAVEPPGLRPRMPGKPDPAGVVTAAAREGQSWTISVRGSGGAWDGRCSRWLWRGARHGATSRRGLPRAAPACRCPAAPGRRGVSPAGEARYRAGPAWRSPWPTGLPRLWHDRPAWPMLGAAGAPARGVGVDRQARRLLVV